VALAVEITAWMQMLALNGHQARRWEPKRLRLRLFTLPATIPRTGRQVRLHLATKAPGSTSSTKASDGHELWPSLIDVHPARPNNHRATPGHMEPAPTRDDTRTTVTPQRQNHHQPATSSRNNGQHPRSERSRLETRPRVA